jgi:hypothetical protein
MHTRGSLEGIIAPNFKAGTMPLHTPSQATDEAIPCFAWKSFIEQACRPRRYTTRRRR